MNSVTTDQFRQIYLQAPLERTAENPTPTGLPQRRGKDAPLGAHGQILDAARGLDEGCGGCAPGWWRLAPMPPLRSKGPSPPVLPALPVVNDLLTLPLAQRLELVQTLWDSIAAEQNGPDLTDADRELIDQRLESFLADGYPGVDADAVLDGLEQSL